MSKTYLVIRCYLVACKIPLLAGIKVRVMRTMSLFCFFHNSKCVVSNLTTISVEQKILGQFGLLKLKTCSLYHENLFIQKVKVISTQVLDNFFSASDIMGTVRCRFRFYGINGIYLTTISVELKILAEFGLLKLKTCLLYHENLL